MDQIQKKYRKFRNPAVPRHEIEYLYDESDPHFIQPDLERPIRPYELDVDKNGVKGLRQTATGKFFYNLETTTIEERLSNGFYSRFKDFLADIKTLAKDAKSMGEDKKRILEAKELVANVEVDMAVYEVMPVFADCENIHLRRVKEAKEAEEKAKKRAAAVDVNDVFNPIGSDIASQSGPPILSDGIPGRVPLLMTPSHISSGPSNGYGASNEHTSNGTSAPSRADTQMTGAEVGFSQDSPMHPPPYRGIMSNNGTQISQRSGWQELSAGTSPSQLLNDASTTTSGKKTSDGWSTQATNGISNHYHSPMDRPQQDQHQTNTQGNYTQETSSEENWPHSQAQGVARGILRNSDPSQTSSSSQYSQAHPIVPPFPAPPRIQPISRPAGFANLLNDTPVEPTSSQMSSQKEQIIDEVFVADLLRHLVDGSSGCSVEQLEQVFRELMDTLWTMRGEWNRSVVTANLVTVFNSTIHDIEAIQKVQMASQPTDNDFSNPSQR